MAVEDKDGRKILFFQISILMYGRILLSFTIVRVQGLAEK